MSWVKKNRKINNQERGGGWTIIRDSRVRYYIATKACGFAMWHPCIKANYLFTKAVVSSGPFQSLKYPDKNLF